ncbi:MAG: hypothetical protein J6Y37_15815, partial [Paludibacteraceae bacterium]|nr:hypothetical protein [Paludibacteraceae bacterium]
FTSYNKSDSKQISYSKTNCAIIKKKRRFNRHFYYFCTINSAKNKNSHFKRYNRDEKNSPNPTDALALPLGDKHPCTIP